MFGLKPIFDRNGHVIGQVLNSASTEGTQRLLTRNGEVKGTYLSTMNITTDRNGNVLGRGNVLGMLIK